MTPAARRVAALLAGALSLGACSPPPHREAGIPAPAAATTPAGATSTTTGAVTARQGAWPTYDHDPGRSGVDPTSPPVGRVRPAWRSARLDGAVFAQPLVVGRTVYVATEDDSVYALDAATGAIRWRRHLASPVPASSLPCGDIDPSGITGTPAADPAAGVLWVVTFSPPGRHTLWALDLRTGAVRRSRPADPPGADGRVEQQRGALVIDRSRVYIPYGGLFGDCSDYRGWLVGVGLAGHDVAYATPTARSGIWAPPGPVVAPGGSIYVATGNGLPAGVAGDSNSVVRLSPSLAVEGVFTASTFAAMSAADEDLGSTSPALLPGGLLFQIGKPGVGYVLRAASLGGVGGQAASAHICSGGFGGTAVSGDVVYVSCYDGLYAVRVAAASPGGRPALTVVWSDRGFRPGPPVIAGGAVWAVEASAGAVVGVAAATGAVLYRHSVSVAGSFPSPSAAAGRLFVPAGDRIAAFAGV